MEESNVQNQSSEFGELFEGETAVFENTLSQVETTASLGNGTSSMVPVTMPSVRLSSATPPRRFHLQLRQPYQLTNEKRNNDTTGLKNRRVDMDQVDGNTQHQTSQLAKIRLTPKLSQDSGDLTPTTDKSKLLNQDYEQNVSSDEGERAKAKVRITKDLDHIVRLNINKHLQKNGFQEILIPKVISKSSVAELINPDISRTNAVAYGPTYRAEEVHEEMERFLRFYQWTKVRNPVVSSELKPMLMPMLVFFFRESYLNGHKPISSKLIGDFSKRVLQEDKTKENCLIVIAMASVKSLKGFEDSYLKQICQRSHKFVLSELTFGQLKKFLSKLRKSVLINILTNHFVIQLRSSQEVSDAFCDNSSEAGGFSGSDHNDSRTSRVQRVLDRLRGSVKSNLPSVTVYTTNGPPACGAVSREATTFAYGMATSGIRICSASSAKNLIPCMEEATEDNSMYQPSIKTMNGHEGAVYGVAFHPKTKLLYSVGQDTCMRVWDLNNETTVPCKAVYRGHFGPIWSMDIASSGQLIATSSMDTTVRLWLPERVDCVRILVGHYFDVDCVRFHPNGSYVATGSVDKSVRLWSVNDGNLLRIMTGSDGKVSTLAFHSSGKYIVGGGDDGFLRLWDIGEGELLAEIPCLNYCKELTFYGSMLAGCFRNGAVQVWNLRNLVGGSETSEVIPTSYSIPKPYTIQCQADTLFKLHYKDTGNLYCLGSDLISNRSEENESGSSVYTDTIEVPLSDSVITTDSPIHIRLDVQEPSDLASDNSISTTTNSNISTINTASEEMDGCVEDADAENTNNTITSSDMEFEVDDQMLESFVDDSNSLLQT